MIKSNIYCAIESALLLDKARWEEAAKRMDHDSEQEWAEKARMYVRDADEALTWLRSEDFRG